MLDALINGTLGFCTVFVSHTHVDEIQNKSVPIFSVSNKSQYKQLLFLKESPFWLVRGYEFT
jgi:hypothetical protein